MAAFTPPFCLCFRAVAALADAPGAIQFRLVPGARKEKTKVTVVERTAVSNSLLTLPTF